MSRKSSIEKPRIDSETPKLAASRPSSLVTRAVPPPAQQVAALQEQLLEEAGLTRDRRIELTTRLIESIERGLEAETVKGPRSVTVPDNMARMRAAELLAQLLNVGTAASRRESNGPPSVIINIQEPEWMRSPTPQPTVLAPVVLEVPAVNEDSSDGD